VGGEEEEKEKEKEEAARFSPAGKPYSPRSTQIDNLPSLLVHVRDAKKKGGGGNPCENAPFSQSAF